MITKRLLIGDFRKIITLSIASFFIGMTLILVFAVLTSQELLNINSIIGAAVLILLILIPGFLILLVSIKHSSREPITINENHLVSEKFGKINIGDIVSCKTIKVLYAESIMITTMKNQKLTISPLPKLSLSSENDYLMFKEVILKTINENKKN